MLTLQLVQLVRPWVDHFLPDLPDMVLSVHIFSFLTETNLVDYVTVVMWLCKRKEPLSLQKQIHGCGEYCCI